VQLVHTREPGERHQCCVSVFVKDESGVCRAIICFCRKFEFMFAFCRRIVRDSSHRREVALGESVLAISFRPRSA